jgi:hypothetical protein
VTSDVTGLASRAGGFSATVLLTFQKSREPMDDPEQEALRRKLVELKTEHRDLDDVIARISDRQPYDQIQLQRLKKRKLQLKDLISHIESQLLPDIIA